MQTDSCPHKVLILAILLVLTGCAVKRPILALYCDQKSADGKHCVKWAAHQPMKCGSTDVYGDCTPGTGPR